MKQYLVVFLVTFLILIPLFQTGIAREEEASPPNQPTSGPGGSTYTHNSSRMTRYEWGANMFWIFEPSDPTPETAPLIIFNHGWSAFHPIAYRMWIDHLVKRGNIVIYPRYQRGLYFGFNEFNNNAITATKNAITILQQGNHVRPQLDNCAIVGHSLGAGITVNMAAQAKEVGLPIPKAIMPVEPAMPLSGFANFQNIANTTLMLVLVGENDSIVGNSTAKNIFYNTTQISYEQKDFVILVTDTYGSPPLLADHLAPLCFPPTIGDSVNALDYYGTWKLFDALTDFAFYGVEKEYCLGNTSQQRFMGLWSDGTTVKEMIITDTP